MNLAECIKKHVQRVYFATFGGEGTTVPARIDYPARRLSPPVWSDPIQFISEREEFEA